MVKGLGYSFKGIEYKKLDRTMENTTPADFRAKVISVFNINVIESVFSKNNILFLG